MTASARQRAMIIEMLVDASTRELEPDLVRDDQRLREDLSLSSLSALALLIDLERQFGCRIADDRLASLRTVGELLDLVRELEHSREREHES